VVYIQKHLGSVVGVLVFAGLFLASEQKEYSSSWTLKKIKLICEPCCSVENTVQLFKLPISSFLLAQKILAHVLLIKLSYVFHCPMNCSTVYPVRRLELSAQKSDHLMITTPCGALLPHYFSFPFCLYFCWNMTWSYLEVEAGQGCRRTLLIFHQH